MSEQTIHLQLFKLILRRISLQDIKHIKHWCFNHKNKKEDVSISTDGLTVKAAIYFLVCEEREYIF